MKRITVFTPTFNRAYCLQQLYESLVNQTSKNFCWLLIDDGSTDTTKELVQSWIAENKIEIQYEYQKNQGMHSAHNKAFDLINTELCVCIDSDDYMTNDAIELIIEKWNSIPNKSNIAGIVGLDVFKNGAIVGDEFLDNMSFSSLYDIYNSYHIKGDKKLVFRTEVIKEYPKYPVFEEERFVPLGTLYLMIDQDYKLACLNKPLCVVEYLPDGSSLNMFNQYKKNPKGFRYARTIELKYIPSFKIRFIKVLHLISSTLFIGDFQFFKNNSQKILTFFSLPFGVLFHLYLLSKIKQ